MLRRSMAAGLIAVTLAAQTVTLGLAPALVLAAGPALAQTAPGPTPPSGGAAADPGQAANPGATSNQGKVVGTPQPAPESGNVRAHAWQSEAMLMWLGAVMLGAAVAVVVLMRRRQRSRAR